MNLRKTRPRHSPAAMRAVAALAAVMVVGTAGGSVAMASTVDGQQPDDESVATAAGPEPEVAPADAPAATAEPTESAEPAPADESSVDASVEPEPEPVTATAPSEPAVVEASAEEAPVVASAAESEESVAPTDAIGEPETVEQAYYGYGVSEVKATGSRDGQVVVTWDVPPPNPDAYPRYWVSLHHEVDPHRNKSQEPEVLAGGTTFKSVPAGRYVVDVYSEHMLGGDGQNHHMGVVVDVPPAVTPPSVPTDVHAKQTAAGAVTVTWSRPTEVGSPELDGYRVVIDDDWSTARTVKAPELSTTFVDVAPGEHSVQVVAVSGQESKSLPASAPVTVHAAPSAPQLLVGKQTESDQVTLSWMAPEKTSYALISDYEVWVDGERDHGLPPWLTSTTIHHLSPGAHTVELRALHAYGHTAATIDVAVNAAPSQPQDLAAKRSAPGEATVTWVAPAALGYPTFDGYILSLDGKPVQELDAAALSATLTGLAPGRHQVWLTTRSKHDEGESAVATVTFEMPAVPSAPLKVTAKQTGPTRVMVSWEDPADASTSGVTGYRVFATPNGSPSGAFVGVLAAGVLAADTVKTVDVPVGTSSADEQTDPWELPSAPRGATATQSGPRQVTVRFDAPADEGSSSVVGYVVGLSGPDSDGHEEFPAETREVVIDDLDPATYDLRVLAVNEEGAGEPVDLQVTVRATAAPPVADAPVVANPVVAAPVRTTHTASTTGTTVSTRVSTNTLARTGSDAGVVAAGGLLLIGLGAGAIAATRRRGEHTA